MLKVTLEVLGVTEEALTLRRRNSLIRPFVAYALCHYAGCTQRESASIMGGCTGVAVSLQLKRLEAQFKKDKNIKKVKEEIEKRMGLRGRKLIT